jgi:hypothetical protein
MQIRGEIHALAASTYRKEPLLEPPAGVPLSTIEPQFLCPHRSLVSMPTELTRPLTVPVNLRGTWRLRNRNFPERLGCYWLIFWY